MVPMDTPDLDILDTMEPDLMLMLPVPMPMDLMLMELTPTTLLARGPLRLRLNPRLMLTTLPTDMLLPMPTDPLTDMPPELTDMALLPLTPTDSELTDTESNSSISTKDFPAFHKSKEPSSLPAKKI